MRRLRVLWVISAGFILFALAPSITSFVTDYLWFREVGFEKVYVTEILAKFSLFVAATLFVYFFITMNARVAVKGVSKAPVLWRVSPELPPVDIGRSIGKATVPLAILNKPGKLTDEEFDRIKEHPASGHALLVEGAGVGAIPLDVCLHHHEKSNGSGYPHGLHDP